MSIAADTGLSFTPFTDEMLFGVFLDGGVEALDQSMMLCYRGDRGQREEEVRWRWRASRAKEEGHIK